MNVKDLCLSFEGRIGRRAYWAVMVPTIVLAVLVRQLPLPASLLVAILVWPFLAVQVKRLHDIGWSGFVILFTALAAAALRILIMLVTQRDDPADFAAPAVAGIPAILQVLFHVFLGLWRGTGRPNQFGPPPGARRGADQSAVFS